MSSTPRTSSPGPELALGTAIRWASLLPDGYRPHTRSDITSFLGYTGKEALFPTALGKGVHVTERMRDTIRSLGLTPKDGLRDRFHYQPSGDGKVVLVRHSPVTGKHWDDRKWTVLKDRLAADGWQPNYVTDGDLWTLEAQLSNAALVVGIDTGPTHLADYIGVPTLALYGATEPAQHGTIGRRSINLHRPYKLAQLSVDDVLAAIHDIARA